MKLCRGLNLGIYTTIVRSVIIFGGRARLSPSCIYIQIVYRHIFIKVHNLNHK